MNSRWLSCAELAVALLAVLVVAWSSDKIVRKSDMEMNESGGRMKERRRGEKEVKKYGGKKKRKDQA